MLNYADLLESLASGHLSGVGIDVFHTEPFPPDDPFLKHPRVYCSPHVAGVTEFSYRAMAKAIAANVMRLIENKDLENVVNF